MLSGMRQTQSLALLALTLMADPSGRHWGYQVSKQSGLRSGVLYPLFQRLLQEGWLEDGWEEIDPKVAQRPPRRYYTLTDLGKHELGGLAARARQEQPGASARIRLA